MGFKIWTYFPIQEDPNGAVDGVLGNISLVFMDIFLADVRHVDGSGSDMDVLDNSVL
jgi:hypothetical protein